MKVTNNINNADRDGFDEGTYVLAVSSQCFATSNKVVRTKTEERALAPGGAQ